MPTIQEDAKKLRDLKNRATEYDRLAKDCKAQATAFELAFMERCQAEDTDSIKVDGTLFVPTSTNYGQITDRDEFIKWAQVNAPELVHLTERKKLVNELVHEYLDSGEPLPPGLDFRVKDYVSLRVG